MSQDLCYLLILILSLSSSKSFLLLTLCYNNSVETVIPMLKKNTAFTSSEPYKRIKADLTAFMAHDGCL